MDVARSTTVILGFLSCVAASAASGTRATAESVAQFYDGKSINLIIPSGTGGGYDRYGRLVARHIGRHIPGQPNIVPQNMPGAGGIVSANFLYNVAPKDGTAFAIIQNGVPFKKLLDPRQVRFDVDGFRWLGSVAPSANIAIVRSSGPDISMVDLKTKELIVGASGGTTLDLPVALKSLLGLQLNIVKGYKSTNDILLAMERKEVGGMIGIDYSSFVGSTKGRANDYRIVFQMGLSPHPEIKNVPLAQDLARNSDERAVMEVLFASFAIGRSFVTPVIPEDRLTAMRGAFGKTMDDPAFRAEADKLGAEVNPLSPQEVEAIIASVHAKPKSIIDLARKLISE